MKPLTTRMTLIYGSGAVFASIILARLFVAWLNDPITLMQAMSDGLFLCH
jgi:hypothetical protein